MYFIRGQAKLAGVDEDMILAGAVKDPVIIAQYQQVELLRDPTLWKLFSV